VSETLQEFPEAPLSGANPALETLEPELPPPPVAGLGRPQAVVAVCLCGVFAFLNLYATQPMLPMFERIFAASKSAAGLTVSAATLGVALSATVFGAMAERLSRKRVIVLSILTLAVPTLLAATSPGLHSLIFWRFLQGLVLPGIFAITITYVGEEWPKESIALVMSIYVSGTALGGFLGRLVGGLTAERLNWHWAFVFLGALTLIGALVIGRWLPTETRSLHGHEGGLAQQLMPMLAHLRNPRLLATFGAGFGMLFALVGTFTYVTFYLADPPFGLSTEKLSWLFAIYLIGLLVTPLGGYLVTRIGMREGMACAIALCFAGDLLTLSHSLWIVVFGGLGLVCTGVFIAQSTAASFLRIAAPEGARASAAGLYLTCYYLGGTAGGVIPGYVWMLGGWPACVALIAVLLLVILVVALVGWKEAGVRE
jgi:MFS transporter, YNFM family, putative membrane transport protein